MVGKALTFRFCSEGNLPEEESNSRVRSSGSFGSDSGTAYRPNEVEISENVIVRRLSGTHASAGDGPYRFNWLSGH